MDAKLSSGGMNRVGLVKTVKPTHYNVHLEPNLTEFIFTGTVKVCLIILKATNTIVLNAHELEILHSRLELENGTVLPAINTLLEKKEQTLSIEFGQQLFVGSNVTLVIEYNGIHNDEMAGFYRSGYTDSDGVKTHLVVTQFQATDCRRCFPCWDEPNLKATFSISLKIPKSLTGLSNMNIEHEKVIENYKCVKFATTPLMSTYIVALAVGKFDFVEAIAKPKSPADAKPITCRVYTLPGKSNDGKFALDVATKSLELYSRIFDISYPLTKCDMLAVADFGLGAMENWGLVIYRESALLYDPDKSSDAAKEHIANIVAHELAHQWFGNLVTMDWWNELWLNEGFATYVSWIACDEMFPEWNVFTSFVNGDFAEALKLDSLRNSHPIDVVVHSPSDVSQVFDAISYSKGATVIQMLCNYLGKELFIKGVSDYLKIHSYSNATTNDLWKSLSKVSGFNIETMMHNWTQKVGFPMITITNESYDETKKMMTLDLYQNRFLSSGDLNEMEDVTVWCVPIKVLTKQGITSTHLLQKKSDQITFEYSKDNGNFYKLNADVTGCYCVCYNSEQLLSISDAIMQNLEHFSPADRIGIISDVIAFAQAGKTKTTDALEILGAFEKETNEYVLQEISSGFEKLKDIWYKDAFVVAELKKMQLKIFGPLALQLGLEYSPFEPFLLQLKRTICVTNAASANDPFIVSELKKKFDRYMDGDKYAIHSNLRNLSFRTAIYHSNQEEKHFHAMLDLIKNGESIDIRLSAMSSLGATRNLRLIKKILNEVIFDAELIRSQDIPRLVAAIAYYCPERDAALEILWNWFVQNFDKLHLKLSSTITLFSRLLEYTVNKNIGKDFISKLEDWSSGKHLTDSEKDAFKSKVKNVERSLEQSIESIGANTNWFLRDRTNVLQWLTK